MLMYFVGAHYTSPPQILASTVLLRSVSTLVGWESKMQKNEVQILELIKLCFVFLIQRNYHLKYDIRMPGCINHFLASVTIDALLGCAFCFIVLSYFTELTYWYDIVEHLRSVLQIIKEWAAPCNQKESLRLMNIRSPQIKRKPGPRDFRYSFANGQLGNTGSTMNREWMSTRDSKTCALWIDENSMKEVWPNASLMDISDPAMDLLEKITFEFQFVQTATFKSYLYIESFVSCPHYGQTEIAIDSLATNHVNLTFNDRFTFVQRYKRNKTLRIPDLAPIRQTCLSLMIIEMCPSSIVPVKATPMNEYDQHDVFSIKVLKVHKILTWFRCHDDRIWETD